MFSPRDETKIKGTNKPQAHHVISPLEYYLDLQFPHKTTTQWNHPESQHTLVSAKICHHINLTNFRTPFSRVYVSAECVFTQLKMTFVSQQSVSLI